MTRATALFCSKNAVARIPIEAHGRAALERLLRYCARPPFAMAAPAQQATVQAGQAGTGEVVTGLTCPLPVGGFDRQKPETSRDRPQLRAASKPSPQLIEISAAVPDLRWAESAHCLHHRGPAVQEDPRAQWRAGSVV